MLFTEHRPGAHLLLEQTDRSQAPPNLPTRPLQFEAILILNHKTASQKAHTLLRRLARLAILLLWPILLLLSRHLTNPILFSKPRRINMTSRLQQLANNKDNTNNDQVLQDIMVPNNKGQLHSIDYKPR